jgi:O-antigen ligase
VRTGLHSEQANRISAPPVSGQSLAQAFEGGLDLCAFVFFPLLVLAPRGVAILASGAGVLAAGLLVPSGAVVRLRRLAVPGVLLGLLLCWGIVSAAWSPNPLRSVEIAMRLAGLFAAGLALAATAGIIAAPRRLSLFLVTGLIIGIVMATADFATHGELSAPFTERVYQPARLNQASVAFAILMAPAAALVICLGRKLLGVAFGLAVAATVFVLAGTAAKAALAIGLAMGLVCYVAPARFSRSAAVLSVLIVVTAPLTFARFERLSALTATADIIKQSFGHRLLIWSFAGDRIDERPLAGWGLDASRAIPGGSEPIEPGETWLPLHPHNAPLQLWLELGVPGAVLFALVATLPWLALATAEWPALFTAAAGAALTAGLVSCLATYGIWQEWWQGTLWFSLFLVLVLARTATAAER